jgi:hypothetical protein
MRGDLRIFTKPSKQTTDGVSTGSKSSNRPRTAIRPGRNLQTDSGQQFDRIEITKQTADGISTGSNPSPGLRTTFRSHRILFPKRDGTVTNYQPEAWNRDRTCRQEIPANPIRRREPETSEYIVSPKIINYQYHNS